MLTDLEAAKLTLSMGVSWDGHEEPIYHKFSVNVLGSMIHNVLNKGKDPKSQGVFVTVVGMDTLDNGTSVFGKFGIGSATGVVAEVAEPLEFEYSGT